MRIILAIILAATAAALSGGGEGDPALSPDADAAGVVAQHQSGVVGGVHDFSGPDGRAGGACDACHVPHVQVYEPVGRSVSTRPADARTATTRPALEMFRIGGQRRVFQPNRYMPGPTSLICLGCHDGTVATSTIGSSHALLAGVREGFAMPDGFVWRDHPIGVPYPTDRREYRPEGYVLKAGIRLPEGRLECISCHDPHNAKGLDGMLLKSNRRSALCLTCHIK